MLSSIIIGGEEHLVRYLRQVSADFADVWIYKVLGDTARRYEVVAALNSYVPDVVFLDVSNLGSPDSICSLCLEEILPQRTTTVVLPFCGRDAVLPVEFGNRKTTGPLLRPPFNADDLDAAIHEGMRRNRPTSHDSQIVAVMPAKPGSGASTVALHLAAAAASTYNQKVLLLEADVYAGALMYVLNLQPTHFLTDALKTRLETEAQWKAVVTRCHGFDFLPTSGNPDARHTSRWDFARLLNHAREHYDTIVVDLPSHINEVSENVLRESDHALLVTTPAPAALNLARRRLYDLERRGLSLQHLQLLVNRYRHGHAQPAAMAEIAHHPVTASLPDDSSSLEAASRRMTIAHGRSRFARQMSALTGSLLALPPEPSGITIKSLRNLLGSAFPSPTRRTNVPSNLESPEAKSEFYHTGSRRQLDRR